MRIHTPRAAVTDILVLASANFYGTNAFVLGTVPSTLHTLSLLILKTYELLQHHNRS